MIEAVDELALQLWAAAVPRALHLLVIGGAVWACDLVMRNRCAHRLRAGGWWLVLLAALMPAGVSLGGGGFAAPAAVMVEAREAPSMVVRAVLALWLLGSLVTLVRVLRRDRRMRRAVGALPPVAEGVRAFAIAADAARRVGLRSVPVLKSGSQLGGAAVVGVRRPCIVVPAALVHDERRLRCVLLHEMAHVAHRDPWQALLVRAARILWWFHPVVACADARLAELREIAADARAVRVGDGGMREYRAAMLESARGWIAAPGASAGLTFFAPRPSLLIRLAALERPSRPAGGPRRLLGAVAFTALAWSCVPLAAPPASAEPSQLQGCLQLRYAVLGAMGAGPSD